MGPTETKSMRNAVSETNRRARLWCCVQVQYCEYRNVTVLEPNGRPNTTDGDEVRYV